MNETTAPRLTLNTDTETQVYYRIAFNNKLQPVLTKMGYIGSDSQNNRAANAIMAPIDEDGNLQMNALHSIPLDGNGLPNGYSATLEDAREVVIKTLEGQMEAMRQAVETARTAELD